MVGLILAAGKSSRMNSDKAFLNYHDLPQFEFAANQLQEFVKTVIINGRPKLLYSNFQVVIDKPQYANHGPMSGLLTVSEKYPSNDIFLLGCDYPQLTKKSLEILYDTFVKIDKSVCFLNTDSGYVEPLIAIYHHRDLLKLKSYFQSNQTSLRYFIQNINAEIIHAPNHFELISFDEPRNV